MKWTTPEELKAQVERLWERGLLLSELAGGESIFPRRLTLRGPDSRQLSDQFEQVREWIGRLNANAGRYRVEWAQVNHRILGANQLPAEVWIDSLEDALGLIGRKREAREFAGMIGLARERVPELVAWLVRRHWHALELADDWPRLLSIVDWIRANPRPGLYLRQIDLPGIDTKFIEHHRTILADLFDLALPASTIDATATGAAEFCRRYGFRDKPRRIRLRPLDSGMPFLTSGAVPPVIVDDEITVTAATFARLDLAVSRVFITENEINFLAFPNVPASIAIFGAGYGFDNLAAADWLARCDIHYWGDIDTHGFAILNQLRASFPRVESMLMDEETLLAHRSRWVSEGRPVMTDLSRLTVNERRLYDQLCRNHWGDRVRLEQERIGFDYLISHLRQLP